MSTTSTTGHVNSVVHRLVPLAHVADVDASMKFYGLLGFTPASLMRDRDDRAFWAMLQSGGAEFMLARASGPIYAAQQAVLFYMYSTDVAALRTRLLAGGLTDGATYCGQPGSPDGTRVVFEVSRPDYMPAGEVRVHDPDGYCILVGQLE